MPQPSIPDSSPWSLTKTVENNAGLTHGVVDEYTQRDLALTVVDRVLTLACHAANPIGCAGRGSGSGVSFPLVRLLPLHIARSDESAADYSSLRSSTGTVAKGLAGGAVLSVVSLLAASLVCMGRPLDGGKLLCIASGTHPALCTADGALSILQSTLDCGTAPLREGSNLRAGRSSGSSRRVVGERRCHRLAKSAASATPGGMCRFRLLAHLRAGRIRCLAAPAS